MNKLLKDPTYKNNAGYNGLDLSSIQNFSSSVGHIIPVTWDFLQPGDKIKVSEQLRTRTMPLISAAFANIEEHVRWFFVPISQIYKPFGDLFNGIQDLPSDFFSTVISNPSRITTKIPSITLGQIYDRLVNSLHLAGAEQRQFYNDFRFFELMGVPLHAIFQQTFLSDEDKSWKNHSINLLPFLAYQKIWYDYFRDSDRYSNDPQAYNLDSFIDNTTTPVNAARLDKILKLRLCPLFKDTCNNLLVSPLFGESGIGGDTKDTLNQVNNWLTSAGVSNRNQSFSNVDNVTPTQTGVNTSNSQAITTASLRSAFAVEKLLEITRRAKKHYDSQILAHFGVKVPMGINGECIEVHHHKSDLVIGDVISKAATEFAPLGEVGGKGFNSDISGDSDFMASTHGVLMCVYYARPTINYLPDGLDKKLAYSLVSDFPRQEFENLGMQPVFRLNQYISPNAVENSTIQGWQYRYQEVKSQYNRVLCGLARTLSSWVVHRTMYYKDAENFYCSPLQINNILVEPYQEPLIAVGTDDDATLISENQSMFNSDPLVHQLKINYRKASKISTYGLSQL